jgi:hypothetical protein
MSIIRKKKLEKTDDIKITSIDELDIRFPLDRSIEEDDFKIEEAFVSFLESIGCDGFGFAEGDNKFFDSNRGGIKTKLFVIRPFYWGDNRVEENKPNFEYFGEEYINIDWYKYPLRSATSNKRLTDAKLLDILEKCYNYYKASVR